MAYLKNDDNKIVIDAILTKYGKEKLANQGSLGITKFAVSDDEVDYSLYNVNNPQGTDYFNAAIVNMPLLEALVDQNLSMKYKLFSTPDIQIENPIDVISKLEIKHSSNFKAYKNSYLIDTGNPYILTPTFNPERSDYNSTFMAELTIDSHDQSGIQYSFYTVNDYATERAGTTSAAPPALDTDVMSTKSVVREGKAFGLRITRFPIKGLKVGITVRIWATSVPSNVSTFNITVQDINNATFEKYATKKQPMLDNTNTETANTTGGVSTL